MSTDETAEDFEREDLITAIMVDTGLTHEFLEVTNDEDFLAALERGGTNLADFSQTAREMKSERLKLEENEKYQAERAKRLLAVLELHPESWFTRELSEAYPKRLADSIRDNLDQSSIWAFIEQVCKNHVALRAKAAAKKAHTENHAMKKHVFQWCDEHFSKYNIIDGAAEAIAGKVVPVKFRTAQQWVSQWLKLQSAS